MFYSDLMSLSSEAAGVTRLVSQRREREEWGSNSSQHATTATTTLQSGAWWAAEIRLSLVRRLSSKKVLYVGHWMELLSMVIKQLGSLLLMCLNPLIMLQSTLSNVQAICLAIKVNKAVRDTLF